MTSGSTLAPDVAAGLANLLGVVADNTYFLGRHLSEWAVGAPGLESAVAAAGIAQGHLGQARALHPFVDELVPGGFPSPDQGSRRLYRLAALDEPFATWGQCVATLYLVDPALEAVLRAVAVPREDVMRRIARVLDESRLHADFARGRLRELVTRWEHGRSHVAAHLRPVMTEVLCWFGPPGEEGVAALVAAGALTADAEGLRQRYLDTVMPTLLELDLDVGVWGDQGAWCYEELPWSQWNRLQRRLETTS